MRESGSAGAALPFVEGGTRFTRRFGLFLSGFADATVPPGEGGFAGNSILAVVVVVGVVADVVVVVELGIGVALVAPVAPVVAADPALPPFATTAFGTFALCFASRRGERYVMPATPAPATMRPIMNKKKIPEPRCGAAPRSGGRALLLELALTGARLGKLLGA
jgi:hypothetical protein